MLGTDWDQAACAQRLCYSPSLYSGWSKQQLHIGQLPPGVAMPTLKELHSSSWKAKAERWVQLCPLIYFVCLLFSFWDSHFAAMAGPKLTMYMGAGLQFTEICLLLLPQGWDSNHAWLCLSPFLTSYSQHIYCMACIEMVWTDTFISFLFRKETSHDRRWHAPLILALRRQRQTVERNYVLKAWQNNPPKKQKHLLLHKTKTKPTLNTKALPPVF